MADTVPYAAVGSAANSLHHAFIRELLLGMDPAGYISLCRVIANAHKSPPKYGKVSCPTLIIAGEEDKSAHLPGCKKIMEALGSDQKEMVVMSKCGHVSKARVHIAQIKSHQMAPRLSSMLSSSLFERHANCILAFSGTVLRTQQKSQTCLSIS